MIVTLTAEELAICQHIGNMRSIIAKNAGVKDAKIGDKKGMQYDVIGMIAEYAFSKHFNTFPNFGLSPKSGTCDGLIKGYRYDIKATTYPNGKLLATLKVNPDVDMYVLAIVSDNQVDIKGFALKEDLIQEANIKDLGHGKGYCLEQSKLRQFK